MNNSLAIFVLSDGARMVRVSYEPEDEAKAKFYHFKTLDATIAEKDLVIIPSSTRYGFTIGKVVAVDVPVNFNDSIDYKWIAGKFNQPAYDDILAQEGKALAVIQQAEIKKQREELRKALLADVDVSVLALPILTPSMET